EGDTPPSRVDRETRAHARAHLRRVAASWLHSSPRAEQGTCCWRRAVLGAGSVRCCLLGWGVARLFLGGEICRVWEEECGRVVYARRELWTRDTACVILSRFLGLPVL
uniref:Uncharacterized protein n=1 Tax=Aegilops tauschii subsp. strangulata TaxID=200361 RepID=A0A453IQ76_AEGTS